MAANGHYPVVNRFPSAGKQVTLKLRVREEAERQGYNYATFFSRCAQFGLVYDAGLRRLWSRGDDYTSISFRVLAVIAQALGAQISPPPDVIGDPQDSRPYLMWWHPVELAYPQPNVQELPEGDTYRVGGEQ